MVGWAPWLLTALHAPCPPGGNPWEVPRMGLGLANSTIGSQWRAKQVQAMALLQRVVATVDPEARMNQQLTVVHD